MTTLRERAKGRWPEIITEILGERYANTNKHGPCPKGEGKDRYRFSDKAGTGTYFCSCSQGEKDGFNLLQCAKDWTFAEAAAAVEAVIGKAEEPVKEKPATWAQRIRKQAVKTRKSEYLARRGLEVAPGLDWVTSMPYMEDGEVVARAPAMLAPVYREGKFLTYHVTYLHAGKKAPFAIPRKILPGPPLSGGACPLYPIHGSQFQPGSELGIAEGVETAIAAKMLFGVPVWAALNTSLMSAWKPPRGVEKVHIFADHDPHLAGHAAAYALAHRLLLQGFQIEIHIPDEVGDWNDVLLNKGRVAA